MLDDKIKNELSALGISVQSFNGDLLYEPWDVYDENGQAFTTFNEYWEKCMTLPTEISQYLAPTRMVAAPGNFCHSIISLFLNICTISYFSARHGNFIFNFASSYNV